ncbi:MAG: TlyA family RNA methyltransferase, partial [Eubacteriales bacterium]
IPEDTKNDDVKILSPSKYVSRGGLKLEAAISAFGIDVSGMTALDIGASTGGFTDCLLQHGAEKVYAVDVGHGQLSPSLLCDGRIINLEGINARYMTPIDIGRSDFPLAVSDISFISQALIYDSVYSLLKDGGAFISLIKPQFECGRENLSSGGICKNKNIHIKVISELFEKAREKSLFPAGLDISPISGGDGNTEYLALFIKGIEQNSVSKQQIINCVIGVQ